MVKSTQAMGKNPPSFKELVEATKKDMTEQVKDAR
jgi:hypothetical protein